MAIPFNLPSDEETADHYKRLDQLLKDLYDVLRQILFRPRPPLDNDSNLNAAESSMESLQERLLALPDLVQSAMIPTNSHMGAATASAMPPRWSALGHPARQRHCHAPTGSFHPYQNQSQLYPNSQFHQTQSHQSCHCQKKDLTSDAVDAAATFCRHPPLNPLSYQPLPRRLIPTDKLAESTSKKTRHKRWAQVGEELRNIAEDFRTFTSSSPRTDHLKASSLFSLLIPATIDQCVWTTVIFIVGWRILVHLR